MPPSPGDLALGALDALQPGDPGDPRARAQDVLIAYLSSTDPLVLEHALLDVSPVEIAQAFDRARARCGWQR